MRCVIAVRLQNDRGSLHIAREAIEEKATVIFLPELPDLERVWLKVEGVLENGDLWGYVDSHPQHAEVQFGDLITIPLHEVEEVLSLN